MINNRHRNRKNKNSKDKATSSSQLPSTSSSTRSLASLVSTINDTQLNIASEEITLERNLQILKDLREYRRRLVNEQDVHKIITSDLLEYSEKLSDELPQLRWKSAVRVLDMSGLELIYPGCKGGDNFGFGGNGGNGGHVMKPKSYFRGGSKTQPDAISGCSSIFGIPFPNGWARHRLK